MTNFNRLCKYSTLLLLFFTSGILFFVIVNINDPGIRYQVFDIFQIPTSWIFRIVDWKFHTNKDNTILVSFSHIAPVVNLLASLLWGGVVLLLMNFFNKKTKKNKEPVGFWAKVFFINLGLSLLFFVAWLFMDLDFIYEGVYSAEASLGRKAYNWFSYIAFIPPP